MKVAIVHDWLVTYAGAERVLAQMLQCYPQADVLSMVDFLSDRDRGFLAGKTVATSWIQNLPGAKKHYRHYLPLMPWAIASLDVSGYDLVISSSHAVAKGVHVTPQQLHVCMCYTPMRYAWDMQEQYLIESNLNHGIQGVVVRFILKQIRQWDARVSQTVQHFMAISYFIAKRIENAYGRKSVVIYPPVDLDTFQMCPDKEDFYLTASRMVPYKKIPMMVQAFSNMPEKKFIVIGDGPDFEKCKAMAGPNVSLLGYQSAEVLKDHLQRAKAFVFAAEEDFGIAPLEAQACGTPVIAFGKGAALETVCGLSHSQPTGLFFHTQSAETLMQAVQDFEKLQFSPQACRQNAMRFSVQNFRQNFMKYMGQCLADFQANRLQQPSATAA